MALALAAPAGAQVPITPAQPVPGDPDAVLVEELVVTARLRGPAWWRVSDADTTVYVLGSPSIAPKHMAWDRSVFERRLQGASVVIVPYQDVRVRVSGAIGAAFNYMRLRSGGPFEDTLDPATRARFVAAREKLGQPAKHYATKNPLAAGLILATDYRDKTGLTNSDPTKLIKYLAQIAKVPVVQKSYDIGPLMGAVIRTSPPIRPVMVSARLLAPIFFSSSPKVTLSPSREGARKLASIRTVGTPPFASRCICAKLRPATSAKKFSTTESAAPAIRAVTFMSERRTMTSAVL